MKLKMKNITALVLAAVIALGLTACGSNSGSSGTAPAESAKEPDAAPTPEYTYKADFKSLDNDDGRAEFAPLSMTSDGMYIAVQEKVGENIPDGVTPEYEGQYDITELRLCFMSMDGKITKLENYLPLKSDIDGTGKRDYVSNSYPQYTAIDSDGNLVVLEQVITSWSEAPEDIKSDDPDYFNYSCGGTDSYIRVLDSTGSDLSCSKIDLNSDAYINNICIDASGNIVIGMDNSVSVYRPDGEKLYDAATNNNYLYSITTLRDGRIAGLIYENGTVVRILDNTAKAFSDEFWTINDSAYELVSGGGDYDFYFTAGSSFYGYSLEDSESTALFNWVDCDVVSDYMHGITVGADGVVRGFETLYNNNSKIESISFVTVSKVPYDSVPQKEHLTLATVNYASGMCDAIVKFNRSNDKYHIDIKDYYEMTGSSDYSAALTKLTTELMAGNLPDLIDLSSNVPYAQLAAKGLLEDLYPYIDADPELSRDDFFPNILSAYEVDGKLCAAVSGFGIVTVEGASSVVGDTPGWTYDDYYAALASMPEGCQGFDYNFTKETMLQIGLAIDMDTYMSWSTGKCNFDSDEFKQLLEFANQFPSDSDMENYEPSDEDSSFYRISQGLQMLQQVSVFNFSEYSNDNIFGSDVTYIGFPNSTGEPGDVISGIDGLGMTTACRNKDAAWQLLRTYLTEDYQKNSYYLPTNKNAFNTLLKNAMKIEYETDANGNILLDENGEKKRLIVGVMYDGTNYTNMYSGISEERAQTIQELVSSASKLLNYDKSILDIVTEQAQAYFAGQKSVDEVAKLVQSKASIYVNEQR